MKFLSFFAVCVAVCSSSLIALPAWAFRCNSYIIDPGLYKAEVMKKCGAPTTQDTRVERRILRVRNGAGGPQGSGNSVEVERELQITIDEWIYNFGPSQFMQLVIFENGRVLETKDLGYGS